MNAESARQLRLLDLQAIDTRLDQIAHARTHLPELAELADLQGKAGLIDDQLIRSRTELADVQREVAKAEADVQLVRDRAARDRARLDAGTGTAKDLQAIQHELVSLATRIEALEAARDEVLARLDGEAAEVGRPRTTVVDEVGADLVALYEKIRTSNAGTGAAALCQRRCGGCQLELNPVEIQRIRLAPSDEVLRCEECRRILVRTPESGL